MNRVKHEAKKKIQIENMAPNPKNLQTLSMKDAG